MQPRDSEEFTEEQKSAVIQRVDLKTKGMANLKDTILDGDRYKVGEIIDVGQQGSVFGAVDMSRPEKGTKDLVIKFSKNVKEVLNEAKTLSKLTSMYKKMRQSGSHIGFPQIKVYGEIEIINESKDRGEATQLGFFIMKKFECTLGQYLHERQKILPSAATKVIDQLIGTLELVHASRRTYNDLKLNNIMVNIKSSGISSALVDFGYADYYCSKEGEHIKPDIQLS